MTHEEYLYAVCDICVARLADPLARARLRAVRISYGIGDPGRYGVCVYRAWDGGHDFVEVSASGEESALQLAATVIHEMAHSLAGWRAGHGPVWTSKAQFLGLARPTAAGWDGRPDNFAPDVLQSLLELGEPTDGRPSFRVPAAGPVRPCPLGIGTHGGTSRGPGSGSRLRLFVCECPVRVRVARNEFHARCTDCGVLFKHSAPSKAGRRRATAPAISE